MRKALFLSIAFVFMLFGVALAQDRTVSGKVTDSSDGSPLPGVNVVIKGTSTGTVTDADGKYQIKVADNATLVFSFVGYKDQEVAVGNQTTIDVTLAVDATALEEVVVTAMGIEREKRSLGYSVASVAPTQLQQRPDSDLGRILNGKVPGMNITPTSGVSGTGTNIIIRGFKSLTGSNQPLFVVDGVPFNSETNTGGNGFNEGGLATSSRFLDLDPNSIENVEVLKGLSAATLYGQQGRNGVILITTKNGKAGSAKESFEVNLNQSYFMNEIASLPDYQNNYGVGFQNIHGPFFSNWGSNFKDVPRIKHWLNGHGSAAIVAAFPEYQLATDTDPSHIGWIDNKGRDNVKDFFRRGTVGTTSLNIAAGQGAHRVNASYTFHDEEGFVPGNTLRKHNFGLGGSTKFADKFTLSSSFNYVQTDMTTPPISSGTGSGITGGAGDGVSIFSDIFYTPRNIELMNSPFENPVTNGPVYYRTNNDIQNPRWTAKYAKNTDNVSRFFGRTMFMAELAKGLSLTYRLGLDTYSEVQEYSVQRGGIQNAPRFGTGFYRTTNIKNTIWDNNLMLRYDKELSEGVGLVVDLGAGARSDVTSYSGLTSTNQVVFGFTNHNNFQQANSNAQETSTRNINGVYGSATFEYKDFLYFNVQGRNDWASSLEKANRSLFYPGASISFIPTTAFKGLESKAMNYMKVRLGYGTSAGFPDPYQTRSTLSSNTRAFVGDGSSTMVITNGVSNFLGNPNLKPELHSELEFGLEGKFLNNRLDVDVSLYTKNTKDLITQAPLDPATGYTVTTVNIGKLKNDGIELRLTGTPFKTEKMEWNITLNFSKYNSVVKELGAGLTEIAFAGYTNLGNFAIPGQPFGVMKGNYYQTNEKGERLVDNVGNYIVSDDIKVLGNPIPDFVSSVINTFKYKGISFNFQIDYRKGGDVYSTTAVALLSRGLTTDTDIDRSLTVVLPGVKASDGKPNDIQTTVNNAMFTNYLNGADEAGFWDGTTIRLREISLGYSLPKSIIGKTPFKAASITLMGNNLWYNAVNMPKGVNFDTDVLGTGVGNGQGFEFMTGPSSKRYGASLKLTF